VEVARDLLGRRLARVDEGVAIAGRIVETEAYIGSEDLACHASKGRTKRTEVMFGPPGVAYVYLIYGMYHCLNAVTEGEGFPAAVLIRAVEPEVGIQGRTDGPGRLCRAMGIDRTLNGVDLTGETLFIASGDRPQGQPPDDALVDSGPRVGIEYAGEWTDKPWRFWLKGNRYVSRAPKRRQPDKAGPTS
jgi:DNA-3-methyladenine glycosylase